MAMTIESVPQGLRNNADDLDRNKLLPILAGRLRAMADAIDANITQPAQAVDDAALEALVEDSGGLWRDDMFRIHEADLMALLRKAATRALSAEKAGWRVPDELAALYIAASKGFHISESCGPDKKYWHVSKFQSLTELHAFEDAWRQAMLSVSKEAQK